ncbi:hypothetical protein MMMB2_3167 [Mycobacterium marinum MB2]|nr:hypothetical protein MMMB2_3167 [Mycobacterium marinum MB2]
MSCPRGCASRGSPPDSAVRAHRVPVVAPTAAERQ